MCQATCRMLEIAVNTTKDILIDIEPVFPWIFQSTSQEDWRSVQCKLVRKFQDLQAPQILFPSYLSDLTTYLSLISLFSSHPGFLPSSLPSLLPSFLPSRHIKLIAFPGLWLLLLWLCSAHRVCGNPDQVYPCHSSNSLCSPCVSVSHFGNSHNISNFFIIMIVMVTCDRLSLMLLL